MRLIFVRHAESAANAAGRWQGHDDPELSPTGRLQAEKLADRFEEEGFRPTLVVTSPLKRAAQTTEILANNWTAPMHIWDDLKEHGVGVFTGLTDDEIKARYPEVASEFERTRRWDLVEGAEPVDQRRARSERVVDRVLRDYRNEDELLLVTHGGILQHILAALLRSEHTWGISASNTAVFDFTVDLERVHLDGDSLSNTSICRIDRFNDASHLL